MKQEFNEIELKNIRKITIILLIMQIILLYLSLFTYLSNESYIDLYKLDTKQKVLVFLLFTFGLIMLILNILILVKLNKANEFRSIKILLVIGIFINILGIIGSILCILKVNDQLRKFMDNKDYKNDHHNNFDDWG